MCEQPHERDCRRRAGSQKRRPTSTADSQNQVCSDQNTQLHPWGKVVSRVKPPALILLTRGESCRSIRRNGDKRGSVSPKQLEALRLAFDLDGETVGGDASFSWWPGSLLEPDSGDAVGRDAVESTPR